ncbi:conserved hypothetical protein [Solidesulfovibrio fructosivorans JJ]]|uniref:Lipoprotein n=1 Tax=Solidesulfovibrio fructosivorans JJ] TaxID=596151 RepID=E1JW76_SOLFR|nr:hypothetical protein [Solidesulfovibrio fructosivorans]EFL51436.1 conserved hypothetical protein [Solidesulfovibrio fructosivorans JJ]]
MRPTILAFLVFFALAAGCTRAPYSKAGVEQATVENDYSDCFSKASLAVNTPPFPESPIGQRKLDTDACMKERGYQGLLQLF